MQTETRMSIPPLVCSTPPPPDQCEEDKDPEDFELQYNLSQDEHETNEYNYEEFSTYNQFAHIEPHVPEKKHNIPQKLLEKQYDIPLHNETLDSFAIYENVTDTENPSSIDLADSVNTGDKINTEEDINIEDLNLKVVQEPAENSLNKDPNDVELNVQNDSIGGEVEGVSVVADLKIGSSLNNFENIPTLEKCDMVEGDGNLNDQTSFDKTEQSEIASHQTVKVEKTDFETSIQTPEVDDDDFGDFGTYQNADKTEVISEENPWESSESEKNNFTDFKANFEQNIQFGSNFNTASRIAVENRLDTESQKTNINENIDDNFGDFDDFQSCDNDTNLSQSVLCFSSTDNETQLFEKFNQVINNIFEEDIPESKNIYESKLESALGIIWGYIKDSDSRQPYMINWNSSLSQKDLLKALCIDSRNILYGPKWINMPKFATNLSEAPLQPQKQLSSTPASIDFTNLEKGNNRASETWTDPFTMGGQEFTYAEALLLDLEHLMATLDQMAHNQSNLKISEILSHACNAESEKTTKESTTRPDLYGIFEGSNNADKIFSSTLAIQPIRQISLPDTHIYTPTNSETPRSKTIHYDSGPSVFLPQKVTSVVQDPLKNLIMDDHKASNTYDDDFTDFEAFKCTNVEKISIENNSKLEDNSAIISPSTDNVGQSIEILQPIKVQPIYPTVNWPDPGEIKEISNDFSDFISSSTWIKEKKDISTASSTLDMKTTALDDKLAIVQEHHPSGSIHVEFDDDFDSFKSALPIPKDCKVVPNIGKPNILSDTCKDSSLPCIATSGNVPDKLRSQAGNTNLSSPVNIRKSIELHDLNIVQKSLNVKLQTHGTKDNSNVDLLQPKQTSPPSFSQSQQNTGQILQPLTLESFSQINWPNPGIDFQDLSRFNPVETLQSLKTDLSVNSHSKSASPAHGQKQQQIQSVDEDVWGEFVSSKPCKPQQTSPKKDLNIDDDDWSDFVSSPSVKPQNGLNTISLNVHTNLNLLKSSNNKYSLGNKQVSVDVPSLNYVTPKSSTNQMYNERHFQNL